MMIPGCDVPAEVIELGLWRNVGARIVPHLEQLLAAHGDRADRDLIDLQYTLAALLHPQACNHPEQVNV